MGAVGESRTRSEVLVLSLHSQVCGIVAETGENQCVVRGVVVRKAAVDRWRRGRIELPAKAIVEGQFGCRLPFVSCKGEEPPLPVARDKRVQIAPCRGRLVEKEAAHKVRDIGLSAICGRLQIIKGECAAGAEGLIL